MVQQRPGSTLAAPVKGLHVSSICPPRFTKCFTNKLTPRENWQIWITQRRTAVKSLKLENQGQPLRPPKSQAPCQKYYCQVMTCTTCVFLEENNVHVNQQGPEQHLPPLSCKQHSELWDLQSVESHRATSAGAKRGMPPQ